MEAEDIGKMNLDKRCQDWIDKHTAYVFEKNKEEISLLDMDLMTYGTCFKQVFIEDGDIIIKRVDPRDVRL